MTAHALSLKDALRSYRTGASFYIPKDKMADIEVVLIDVLESIEQGRHPWWRWHERWLLFGNWILDWLILYIISKKCVFRLAYTIANFCRCRLVICYKWPIHKVWVLVQLKRS